MKPPDVTLLVKEPTRVDVEIQTITTIFRETGGATPEIIYNRKEKYVVPEALHTIPMKYIRRLLPLLPPTGRATRKYT